MQTFNIKVLQYTPKFMKAFNGVTIDDILFASVIEDKVILSNDERPVFVFSLKNYTESLKHGKLIINSVDDDSERIYAELLEVSSVRTTASQA